MPRQRQLCLSQGICPVLSVGRAAWCAVSGVEVQHPRETWGNAGCTPKCCASVGRTLSLPESWRCLLDGDSDDNLVALS